MGAKAARVSETQRKLPFVLDAAAIAAGKQTPALEAPLTMAHIETLAAVADGIATDSAASAAKLAEKTGVCSAVAPRGGRHLPAGPRP
jgi:hypothetical protein